MAGVMAGRVKDVPAVVAKLDDITVFEGPIDAHAAMFMPPNGHVKGLAQEVFVSNVVAVPMGVKVGLHASSVAVDHIGQMLHAFSVGDGRIDDDNRPSGRANEVAVRVIGGGQGRGRHGNDLYPVGEEDGSSAGLLFGDESHRFSRISTVAAQAAVEELQQGNDGRSDAHRVAAPVLKEGGWRGPAHLGEFRLWLKVEFGRVVHRTKMNVEEGVVKLHGPERWRGPLADDPHAAEVDGWCAVGHGPRPCRAIAEQSGAERRIDDLQALTVPPPTKFLGHFPCAGETRQVVLIANGWKVGGSESLGFTPRHAAAREGPGLREGPHRWGAQAEQHLQSLRAVSGHRHRDRRSRRASRHAAQVHACRDLAHAVPWCRVRFILAPGSGFKAHGPMAHHGPPPDRRGGTRGIGADRRGGRGRRHRSVA